MNDGGAAHAIRSSTEAPVVRGQAAAQRGQQIEEPLGKH